VVQFEIAVPQRLKPHSRQGGYRSGEPLRHPKAKSKANAKTFGGRYRGIPPLRKKRARMGHPSVEMIAAKKLGFSALCGAAFKTRRLTQR
jgi:hypothetical protein